MNKPPILVVEDDRAIRRGLVDALTFAGHPVLEADNGQTGVALALQENVALVLLDVVLPAQDGFSVLAQVRQVRPDLPVIMLTARGTEEDRVRGLRGGADDYVVKPFSARELLARVEAVLRRTAPEFQGAISINGRTIDFGRSEVRFGDGEVVALTEKEVELLKYLASNDGRVVSRDELLSRVWGIDPRGIRTRTIDMHIMRLRERLRDDPESPQIVVTVRGRGYALARPEQV